MRLNLALGGLAAANLAVGLAIQWYVVTRLGVGVPTDALFAGMAVPQFVLEIVSGSLMHVLVPLLASEDSERFRRTVWALFLGIGALFSALAVLLAVTAPWWLHAMLPGFSPDALRLTVSLTRIQLIGMVSTAVLSVLWSAYHARRQFLWAEFTPILASGIAFALLVATLPRAGIAAAAWANVGRSVLAAALLLPGLGAWRRPDWRSPELALTWKRIRPLLLGTSYYKADPLVDRYLASMAPAGGLSILYIGRQIWGAVGQIANRAIASPMVPLLAARAKAGAWAEFRRGLNQRLIWAGALTGGGFALFLAVGQPVLRLLIGHGGVTAANVVDLWRIMVGLGGILVAGTMGQLTSAAFYSYGDTKTPTWLGILTFSIYVPAKIAAFFSFGLMGVAVATSAFLAVNLVLQLVLLERELARRVRAA